MENPRLGGRYPFMTQWRCPVCLWSVRIANAGEREWCMNGSPVCGELMRLLTLPLVVPVERS